MFLCKLNRTRIDTYETPSNLEVAELLPSQGLADLEREIHLPVVHVLGLEAVAVVREGRQEAVGRGGQLRGDAVAFLDDERVGFDLAREVEPPGRFDQPLGRVGHCLANLK